MDKWLYGCACKESSTQRIAYDSNSALATEKTAPIAAQAQAAAAVGGGSHEQEFTTRRGRRALDKQQKWWRTRLPPFRQAVEKNYIK